MKREEVMEILEGLQLLPFFPTGAAAMSALTDLVFSMATDLDQVRWLVKRMTTGTFETWPGPVGVRQAFCSKFKPADGYSISSSPQFPDAFPSEKPEPSGLLALPPGHKVSADPALEASVRALAEVKDINRVTRPPRVPTIPIVGESKITQADVDREVDRLREERARREFKDDGDEGDEKFPTTER